MVYPCSMTKVAASSLNSGLYVFPCRLMNTSLSCRSIARSWVSEFIEPHHRGSKKQITGVHVEALAKAGLCAPARRLPFCPGQQKGSKKWPFDYPTRVLVHASSLRVLNPFVFFHPRLTGPGEQARTGCPEQTVVRKCNSSGWYIEPPSGSPLAKGRERLSHSFIAAANSLTSPFIKGGMREILPFLSSSFFPPPLR